MPKPYEQMSRRERTQEYKRLEAVLKKQVKEKPPRAHAMQITVDRMAHLHQLHTMDKQDDPDY